MIRAARYMVAAVVAAVGLAGPLRAEGTVRAVLVGVSDYLYLDADLRGPRNDVGLMRAALLARGVAPENITVLSQDAEAPTRTAILAALDDLAAQSAPGDTALFYFSGHGTQAPDRDGDEQGGLDEIFLPADARGWSGSAGMVENAISDDEFRAKAQTILARGARLVAVLDACHSATGFRALGGQGVARTLPPALLGIPDAVAGEAGAPPAPLTGDFVFLYAAQAEERAFEYPVGPPDDPESWHGGFTRALAQVLQTVPELSWQQAMQAARAEIRQAAQSQTPDAEGPLLQAAVFGAAAPPAPRVAFEGDTLKAGRLAGVGPGARLALYADAAGGAVLARAEVSKATAHDAALRILEGAPPKAGYAVQTAPALPPDVRFSAPQPADDGDYAALQAELARIADQGLIDGVRFGAADFDIGLVLTGGQVALTGPDGVLDAQGPGASVRVAPGDLLDGLDRAARVHRLRAALGKGGRGGAAALLAGSGLTVELGHRAGRRHGGACARQVGPERRPVADGHGVSPCDQVWIHLKNTALTAQDVTVLYIDSANGVTALWPTGGLSNRIGFNEEVVVGVQIVESQATRGREELIVIGVPAEPGAPRTVLTALADPAPSRAAGGGSPAAEYLLTAADPGRVGRGFSLLAPVDPVQVTRVALDYFDGEMEN